MSGVSEQLGEAPESTEDEANAVEMSVGELRFVQVLASAAGVTLLVLALLLWWPQTGPTQSVVVDHTVTTRSAPGATTPDRLETVRTTTTSSGDVQGGGEPQAPGAADRRSEVLSVAMLSGGVALLLVGLLLPRLRGGSAGPEGVGILIDPVVIRRRVTASVRRQIDVDPRIARAALPGAVDAAIVTLEVETRGGEKPVTQRAIEQAARRAVRTFVAPPEVKSGDERYVADFLASRYDDDEELGRLAFWPGSAAPIDVLAASPDVEWTTDAGREVAARIVLQHVQGDTRPTTETIQGFLAKFGPSMPPGRSWSILLADVLEWLHENPAR